MAADPLGELMSDGLAAPLGDVIAAVGRGVAEAQAALDHASLSQTLAVYESEGDAALTLLREIGYRPTFYVLPETTCEVQVSMRVGGSGADDGSAGAPGAPRLARTYVTPVDAGFASRYAYEAQAAAKLTFKIVPVPPPAALDDSRPAPNLVGRPAQDAIAALEALGFAGEVRDAQGNRVETPGALTVLSQSVAPSQWLALGATVSLTVERPVGPNGRPRDTNPQ
jgi:PASTA domain